MDFLGDLFYSIKREQVYLIAGLPFPSGINFNMSRPTVCPEVADSCMPCLAMLRIIHFLIYPMDHQGRMSVNYVINMYYQSISALSVFISMKIFICSIV